MYKETHRPAWVEINLKSLDYNIKNIIAKAEGHEIIGVVKANSYGHGMLECAEVLRANGVRIFAVATLDEAIRLRDADFNCEIIVLGLIPEEYADLVVMNNLTPVFCSASAAKAYSAAATALGRSIRILMAVDTGMGRIGYLADNPDAAIADLREIEALPGVELRGMFSHMSTADEADKTYANMQAQKFMSFYNAVTAAGIDIPWCTLANSAGIMELPETLHDAVRPGIILYGLYPSSEVDKTQLDIKPVMQVKANVVYVKDVPAGTSVSYGRKYTSSAPAKIATVGVGYADGFHRAYSPYGKVIINGCYAPIAGNICMDQFMIDVTDVPDVKIGDEVIIMGSDGKLSITADEIADALGTINYEITCSFGLRLPKIFIR